MINDHNQRSDLLENLASEAAKENLCVTVQTLDVTKKVTKFTKCEETVLSSKSKSVPNDNKKECLLKAKICQILAKKIIFI